MNILITGGGGFIGRNLKRLLSAPGYDIFAPSHQELDVLNSGNLYASVIGNKIDIIIHTATAGGTFEISYDNFKENLAIFDSIVAVANKKNIPVIIIGSGAEFDRRYNVENATENLVFERWPVDLYGLSKNIIARRAHVELKQKCILRLFGCFGEDEKEHRFIKRSIQRLKNGMPIQLENNRLMDFFYIDDVVQVVQSYLRGEKIQDINLVYQQKMDIFTIAKIIEKEMGISMPFKWASQWTSYTTNYTGNGNQLNSLKLPLIGLEEGIKRMVKALV
jgi:UDP-glucose 4-epimerase